MADNVTLPATGAGTASPVVSTEEVTTLNGGAVSAQHVQRVIPSVRTADGVAVDVSAAASLPVIQAKAATGSAPAQTSQGTTAAQVLTANANRRALIIVNTGLTTIKLILGTGTPTQTAYHIALVPAGVADDGSGGSYESDTWTGAVQAISTAAGGTLVIAELTA